MAASSLGTFASAETKAGPVHEPRHFLVYRFDEYLITIGRLLYAAMDLARHTDPETTWE